MMFNQTQKKVHLTQEQQTIVQSKAQVVVVDAPAGTGKSFMLMEIAKKYRKGLYLAFNKAMVQSIMEQLPQGWTCKTFNAFGLMLCKRHMRDIRVNFNKRPTASQIGLDLAIKHMQQAESLTDDGWKRTCDRYQIPHVFIDKAVGAYEAYMDDTSQMGGEEMMYRPVMNGWQSDKYDVVLVDEIQDMNPLQVEMLKLIPTNRLVLVGDRMQAISSFRGADPRVFHNLITKYHGQGYTLRTSFSCPQSVLKVIHNFVPNLVTMGPQGYVAKSRLEKTHFPEDCLILSRGNSQLVYLALYFLNQGMKFSITPHTVAKFNEYIKQYCYNGLEEGRKLADQMYQNELNNYRTNNWSTGLLTARAEAIRKLLYSFNTMEEIHAAIGALNTYKSGTSKRRLMTIHTAKGLNHDNVFIFNPSLSAKIADAMKHDWQKQEERNLFYVACTRSTNGLVMVDP